MGYLHQGHISLVNACRNECDFTAVSIFVNPMQFAPSEDLNRYPRDFERDSKLLSEAGCDLIFFPDVNEIYPEGFQSSVEVLNITKTLEGEFRPEHFKGVTTVVAILFNIVQPDFAYFGQKDAQQAAVIMKMVEDLKFNVIIRVQPIVRENDGLAMSSRNVYLSANERKDAVNLYRVLREIKTAIEGGESDINKLLSWGRDELYSIPNASLDYLRLVEQNNFLESSHVESGKTYLLLVACRIGKTRLIDNVSIVKQ